MKSPPVKINLDLEKELDAFMNFLDHPKFPQHRNVIFKAFPELKGTLDNIKDIKKVIREFIENFYKENNKKIQEIIKESKEILHTKVPKGLEYLSKLMDYKWTNNHAGYLIVPTILPFSPFKDNLFYYSILSEIKRGSQNNLTNTAIHEISHFLLFDTLKAIGKNNLSWIELYFLKETLAPTLMSQQPLKDFLRIEDYLGNDNLYNIFVSNNGENVQISMFVKSLYEKERYENGKSFEDILKIMINIFESIRKDLEKKNNMWNKYGSDMYSNKGILSKYKTPIKIHP